MAILDFVGKWKDKVTDYVDMRVQLVKLNIIEQVSKVLSYFIFMILCLLFLLPVLFFSGIGFAEYIASLVNSTAAGYAITAGIYLAVLLILFAFRKKIIKSFTGLFINVMTDDEDDEQPAKKTE